MIVLSLGLVVLDGAHYPFASHIPMVIRLSAQDVPSCSVRGKQQHLAQLCEVQGNLGRIGGG